MRYTRKDILVRDYKVRSELAGLLSAVGLTLGGILAFSGMMMLILTLTSPESMTDPRTMIVMGCVLCGIGLLSFFLPIRYLYTGIVHRRQEEDVLESGKEARGTVTGIDESSVSRNGVYRTEYRLTYSFKDAAGREVTRTVQTMLRNKKTVEALYKLQPFVICYKEDKSVSMYLIVK